MLTALLLATALAQAEPASGAPTPAPAAPTPEDQGKPIVEGQPAGPTPQQGANISNPQSTPHRAPSLEEVNRQLERIKKLPASEMTEALERFRNNASNLAPTPQSDPAGPKFEAPLPYAELSEPEQVMWNARNFFNDLIAGDARGIVLASGYPFYLEDRRLELPEELHDEWLKNLRSKRTDLLTLYDIEILTPAEMEKKYGKPPARLKDIPWKTGKTYLAVGNLSGHACVAVFRESSIRKWQLVGYTD